MAEWDGVFGYDGMNNFYLYRIGDQARLIPWDRDQAFHAADYPLLAGAASNVIGRRLLEDPELRAAYVQAVTEAMAAAEGDAWLEREFTRQYTLIRDAAMADPFKHATNEEFEQAFAELVAFARTRPGVRRRRARAAALKRSCGSSDPPQGRVKTIRCCQGRSSKTRACLKPSSSTSVFTCSFVILCSGRIGTFGSSARYSNSASRPPGFSASCMRCSIRCGCENSW